MSYTPPLSPIDTLSSPPHSIRDQKYGYIIAEGKWHEVIAGEMKIGRDSSMCDILLSEKSVSKMHAVIESEGPEDTFLYDVGSTNKSRIGKMTLKSRCRYKLNDNDSITLGGISLQYRIVGEKVFPSTFSGHSKPFASDENAKSFKSTAVKSMPKDVRDKSDSISEIFLKPSTSVLKMTEDYPKKIYYKCTDSISDNFNKDMQCDIKENNNFVAKSDYSSDDIYNVTTQVEDNSDSGKQNISSLLECSTLREVIGTNKNHGIVDYSEPFGFMNNNDKNKNYFMESLGDEIFNLSTQCTPNIVTANEQLNLKDKIYLLNKNIQSENLQTILKSENDMTTSNINSNTRPELKSGDNDLTLLSDGEDEELCEFMRNNSPIINVTSHSSSNIAESKETEEINTFEQTINSRDIFDVATQLFSNECDLKSLEISQKGTSTEFNVTHPEMKQLKAYNTEQAVILNGERNGELENINKIENSSCLVKLGNVQTQNPTPKEQITRESNVGVVTTLEENRDMEDLIATQLFKTSTPKSSMGICSLRIAQDDISTQIFPGNNQIYGCGNVQSVSYQEKSNKFVKPQLNSVDPAIEGNSQRFDHLIQSENFYDSDDQTDSDLEIKLDYNNRDKMELRESGKCAAKGSYQNKSDKADERNRSLFSSSNKTESDLEICEVQRNRISPTHENQCNEDANVKQIERVTNDVLEFQRPSTNHDDHYIISSTEECDGEDYIATQIFSAVPVREKSLSESTDKTTSDSDIVEKPIVALPEYEIVDSSSENDVFEIEENSCQSESLIKVIKEENLGSKTVGHSVQEVAEVEMEVSDKTIQDIPIVTATERCYADEKSTEEVENNLEKELDTPAAAYDSDETDCEEELKIMNEKLKNSSVIDTTALFQRDLKTFTSSSTNSVQNQAATDEPGKRNSRTMTETRRNKSTSKSNRRTSFDSDNLGKDSLSKVSPFKRGQLFKTAHITPKKKSRNSYTHKKITTNENENIGILQQYMTQWRHVVKEQKELREENKEEVREGKYRRGNAKSETKLKNPYKNKLTMEDDLLIVINECSNKISDCNPSKSSAGRVLRNESLLQSELGVRKSLRLEQSNVEQLKTRKWANGYSNAVKIIYTGIESGYYDKIISKLNGLKVDDVGSADVLVTDQVRRTVKFLSAVALGLPIVSPKWLISSEKELEFLDPWNFLLDDWSSEERWGFNLSSTLQKWRKEKLLKGYTVYATMNTKPPVPEILNIVECCGGKPLCSKPDTWPAKSIVLTSLEDKKSWPLWKHRHVKIVHYEFLLSGILRYSMDFKNYKLR